MTYTLNSFYSYNQKKIYIVYSNHFNSLKTTKLQFFKKNKNLYIFGPIVYLNSFQYNYKMLKKCTFTNYRILLRLNGVNFKFSIVKNYLQCVLGYSHLIYILIPKGINVNIVDDKKNLLLLESFNYSLIMSLIYILKKIKPINSYNLTGICLNSVTLKKKIGKKK